MHLLVFTDTLTGEDYVSVSYFKPVLHLFKNDRENDTYLTNAIKITKINYINYKYTEPELSN